MAAEDLVLEAILKAWHSRRAYNIRKGVTPDTLLRAGLVYYSRSRLYDLCNRLKETGRVQKIHYGGYIPLS